MNGTIRVLRTQRRGLPVAAAMMLAALLPPVILAGLAYVQALRSVEATLEQTVAGSAKRTNRLLQRAETARHRFIVEAKETGNQDPSRRLARLGYDDPRFREAGVIDKAGNLVATNLGLVQPPVPVPPAERSDRTKPSLQVIGLVRTLVMEERSAILALPLPGEGEVNVLVDPQVLTAYLHDFEFGPTGSSPSPCPTAGSPRSCARP
jgi:sensor c-di-GMP phosphodiesterase-like protein